MDKNNFPIIDRFEPEDSFWNPCDDCKFRKIRRDNEFPCSNCENNVNHV